MKDKFLKIFIIILLLSFGKMAFADQDTVFINNNLANILMHSEYQCKILSSNCVVDKVKNMQTGNIYYDAECTTSRITKPAYESNVIDDIRSGRFMYCSRTSRNFSSK